MRDIRGDLQDRANLLEEQCKAQQAQFEKLVEQLKREHESRLEELRIEQAAVNTLMEIENRRMSGAGSMSQTQPKLHQQPQPQPVHSVQSHKQQAAQPHQPLADFLIRKLGEVGAMSRDDLRRLAVQEGYFADGDSAERGVHATLVNVVKAGFIRQLPNGNFAPATVLDTIRMRRAI
ncbi:MAG: hypothetical protein FJX44_01095 [Alphaproteobacteria bacterium]|nr:hypothetical protein [Alphaproteobacteria bacterium]